MLRFVTMNKLHISLTLIGLLFALNTPLFSQSSVNWLKWEEAVEANKKKKKKIYVDVYTDWCGWCKRMDQTTFQDPKVIKYLNEHFYPVKFNAEQKEKLTYNGHTFEYQQSGRRGVHMFAVALLDRRLSYPTTVGLNEELQRVLISPGYKDAEGMLKELRYIAEEHYKTTKWEEYN